MTLDTICNFLIIFLSLAMFALLIGLIIYEQRIRRVSLFEIMYLLSAPSISLGFGLSLQWGLQIIYWYGFLLLMLNLILNSLAEERR